MAFGKKSVATFDKARVYDLAAEAMRNRRTAVVQLPFRLTLDECLMNHFSNKAMNQMLEKMVGITRPKEQKDLTKAFEESQYRNTKNELVVPCRILKASIVEGAVVTGKAVSKAELKRDLRVMGDTAPIVLPKGANVEMDVRLVRNMTGVPDVRARALIPKGSTVDFVVQFPTTLTPDKVIAALEGAGQSIGLFDFRPEKGGDKGTFVIELLQPKHIEGILRATAFAERPYVLPPELLQAYGKELTSSAKRSDPERKAEALLHAMNGAPAKKTRGRRSALEA